VGRWVRIGKNPGRLTFLTVGMTFHQPVIKDEGYYEAESGCFQPFAVIDEARWLSPWGLNRAGPQHYAKVLGIRAAATREPPCWWVANPSYE